MQTVWQGELQQYLLSLCKFYYQGNLFCPIMKRSDAVLWQKSSYQSQETTQRRHQKWAHTDGSITYVVIVFQPLRFCKTAITWLRPLSAILPLFWRHGIANFPAFASKIWEMLLWRHEIHDVFPRNWANALQNLQFFHHFTMKFDIFSLNSTGDSDFLILFLSTQNKISMSSF